MKLKLSSSMRTKKRYLLIEAESEDEVKNAILEYIGILGWAKASPQFVKKGKKIVLAINREEIENIRAAFSMKGEITITKVSGTLKGLFKE